MGIGLAALIILAAAGTVMFLARGNDESSTARAEPTRTTDTSANASEGSATTAPTRTNEQRFIDTLEPLGVPIRMAQRGYDEQALINDAKANCDKIRSGVSVGQLQMAMASEFVRLHEQDIQYAKDSGYLLAVGVKAFCPEFAVQLNAP